MADGRFRVRKAATENPNGRFRARKALNGKSNGRFRSRYNHTIKSISPSRFFVYPHAKKREVVFHGVCRVETAQRGI